MNTEFITIDCIEVVQPLGTFYVGKISYKDLIDIAYSDVRRIEQEEENELESYFGIQRSILPARIKEISEYVTNIDAAFPSSILLAIKSIDIEATDEFDNITYNKSTRTLRIKKDKRLAHIIDGQHRLFGMRKAVDSGFNEAFELVVTIFVDMDIDDQAMVFSTINRA